MTIFIHIGSHKTSTTAIQSFTARNRDWFARNGLIYNSFDLIGGEPGQSHWELIRRLSMDTSTAPDDTEAAQRVLSEMRRLAEATGRSVLISAESMFRLDPVQRTRVTTALRHAFKSHEIRVVATLRRPEEFADSLYRNMYRVYRRKPPSFQDWIAVKSGLFDYHNIISSYEAEIGGTRTILVPYHKLNRAHFVALFFENLGIDIAQAPEPIRTVNTSLDTVDCLAKRDILKDGPDPKVSEAFNAFARREPLRSGYGFFDHASESVFRSSLAASNEKLLNDAPHMAPVLDPDRPFLNLNPLDEAAHEMVKARAMAFLQT